MKPSTIGYIVEGVVLALLSCLGLVVFAYLFFGTSWAEAVILDIFSASTSSEAIVPYIAATILVGLGFSYFPSRHLRTPGLLCGLVMWLPHGSIFAYGVLLESGTNAYVVFFEMSIRDQVLQQLFVLVVFVSLGHLGSKHGARPTHN